MKNYKSIILNLIIFSGLFLFSNSSTASIIFEDDFETGDLSHIDGESGANWLASNFGSGDSVSVSSENKHNGNHSLKFLFGGNANLADDAWAEQRFDLGGSVNDLYARYYIYFPENYSHRSVSPSNNKLIRVWSEDANYSGDDIKMGASFNSNNVSLLYPEANAVYEGGMVLDYSGAQENISSVNGLGTWTLTNDDLGRWICFEWHFSSDSGLNDGIFEFWVDGVKQFGSENMSFRNAPPSPNYFKTGYLMGWANSGFNEDTFIFIDDVVFSDQYIGPIESSDTTPPSAPSGLSVS